MADEAPQQVPDVEDYRGPARFVPEGFRELGFAAARRRQQQDASGTPVRLGLALPSHRPQAERLQVVEAAELVELFIAAVDRDQPALLELAGFDFPERVRLEFPVPDKGEAVRVLSLAPGQALGSIDYPAQFLATGQFAVLSGDPAGDLCQLGMVRQFVIDAYEEFLQLNGHLVGWSEYHEERSVVLPGDGLPRHGLHEFHAAEEPMQVLEQQDRCAGAIGDLRHGPDHSERVLRLGDPRHRDLLNGKLDAGIAVPCADPPAFLPAQVGDLPDGFVGLGGLYPDASEAG